MASQSRFHPTAIVDSQDIGDDTQIWAYAHVLTGAKIGCNCNVGDHAFIEGGASIGDNVTVKNNVCVWDGVTIEDDVFIGPNVTFTNDLFPRSPRMREAQLRYADKRHWLVTTLVQRGCTIGAGATIIAGIRLGRYSFIAAGALVTADVAPFTVAVGSPARHSGFVCWCGQRLSGTAWPRHCAVCGRTLAQPPQ